MIHMTLEREPLKVLDGSQVPVLLLAKTSYGEVTLGVRVGLAFRADTDEVFHDSDPWFCVRVHYPGRKRSNGAPDYDDIVTNGDEYWRARRSLGRSPLVLTAEIAKLIDDTVSLHLGLISGRTEWIETW
jgi:hypothetical protein